MTDQQKPLQPIAETDEKSEPLPETTVRETWPRRAPENRYSNEHRRQVDLDEWLASTEW